MTPLETMNKNQKKDKARKKEDLPTGNALEPSYVYRTLLQVILVNIISKEYHQKITLA